MEFDKNNILPDHWLLGFDPAFDVDGFLRRLESPRVGFKYKGKSLAEMVNDGCRRADINQRVLLVTMQKEQSALTAGRLSRRQMDWLLGFGVPDAGGKRQRYRGMDRQIVAAARQLRSYVTPGTRWYVGAKVGKAWRVSDGTVTCENIATAALYRYTPWIGEHDFGPHKAPFGNYLFWRIWQRYFPQEATEVSYPRVVHGFYQRQKHFGKMKYRYVGGGRIQVINDFIESYIIRVDMPIIGPVYINRLVAETLREVLTDIEDDKKADLINLDDFRSVGGTWVLRTILWQKGKPPSPHAHGIAIDINVREKPDGGWYKPPRNNYGKKPGPRCLALRPYFERHGWASGSRWKTPDPMHWEASVEAIRERGVEPGLREAPKLYGPDGKELRDADLRLEGSRLRGNLGMLRELGYTIDLSEWNNGKVRLRK